jgi:hypothetical protein
MYQKTSTAQEYYELAPGPISFKVLHMAYILSKSFCNRMFIYSVCCKELLSGLEKVPANKGLLADKDLSAGTVPAN